jgi:hypothetical protein
MFVGRLTCQLTFPLYLVASQAPLSKPDSLVSHTWPTWTEPCDAASAQLPRAHARSCPSLSAPCTQPRCFLFIDMRTLYVRSSLTSGQHSTLSRARALRRRSRRMHSCTASCRSAVVPTSPCPCPRPFPTCGRTRRPYSCQSACRSHLSMHAQPSPAPLDRSSAHTEVPCLVSLGFSSASLRCDARKTVVTPSFILSHKKHYHHHHSHL